MRCVEMQFLMNSTDCGSFIEVVFAALCHSQRLREKYVGLPADLHGLAATIGLCGGSMTAAATRYATSLTNIFLLYV